MAEVVGGLVERGDGIAVEDTAGGVEVVTDVVEENFLEILLGGLVAVVGDLLEGFVGWGEDGVVGLCAVEDFDQVVVFVDKRCELRGVLALVDEL